jgi:hypothetical protein
MSKVDLHHQYASAGSQMHAVLSGSVPSIVRCAIRRP